MATSRSVALWVAFVFLASGYSVANPPVDQATHELFPHRQSRCGVDCLYIVINDFIGSPPDYESLAKNLGLTELGVTLGDLGRVTNERGLYGLTVHMTLDQLTAYLRSTPIPSYVICHLSHSHYVLAYRDQSGLMCIFDPGPREVAHDTSLSNLDGFSGNCLIITREPISIERLRVLAAPGWTKWQLAGTAVLGLVAFCWGWRGCASIQSRRGGPDPGTQNLLGSTLIIGILTISSGCQRDGELPTIPSFVFGSRSTIDLGTVYYDSNVLDGNSFSVVLRNNGDDSINVKSILSSCGCSQANLEKDVIPSGVSSVFGVKMSPGMAGDRELSFTIEHGDHLPPTELLVRGSFFDAVQAEPNQLLFDRADDDSLTRSGVAFFKIISPSRKPPKVQLLQAKPDELQIGEVELRGSQPLPGRSVAYQHSFRVTVTVPTEHLAKEPIGDRLLELHVEGREQTRQYSVAWRSGRHLMFAPEVISLNRNQRDQKVALHSLNYHPFTLSEASAEEHGAWITVDLPGHGGPQERASIVVRADPELAKHAPSGKTKIRLKSDLTEHALMIPVSWDFSE